MSNFFIALIGNYHENGPSTIYVNTHQVHVLFCIIGMVAIFGLPFFAVIEGATRRVNSNNNSNHNINRYRNDFRSNTMFNELNVLIIKSANFKEQKDVDKLVLTIENHDGKAFVKEDHDNSINYVAKYDINHIITTTIDFIEYELAKTAMIPMTIPEWVYDSVGANKLAAQTKYNPDSKLFLKNCFVCIGDDILSNDKEIIYGGIKAFGGLYMDMLTTHTTHLITTELSSDKSILARSSELDIKVVTPNWIDDCFKMGKRLNENNYLLESEIQLSNSTGNEEDGRLITDSNEVPNQLKFNTKFLTDKRFYISDDYHLSKNIRQAINSMILKNGGKIASKYSDKIDIYIGKYRQGKEFHSAYKSNRIIVGNLQWLYSLIVNNKWVLPVNSLLLHYPVPSQELGNFNGLKISVTNYSHDARYYLSRLITILGGTFTKNLTKENDFLIVGKPVGEKYAAANNKWIDDNGNQIVKVVNHLWLEECYANWEFKDPNIPKYQHLGYDSSRGMETLIGRTKLNKEVLGNWVDSDIDDSMDDNILKATLSEETDYSSDQGDEGEKDQLPAKLQQSPQVQEDSEKSSTESQTQSNEPNPHVSTEPSQTIQIPYDKEPKEAESFSSPVSEKTHNQTLTEDLSLRPRGRSAKAKATLKLHDDMDDLAKYQELAKSSRKMKNYMRELENNANKRKEMASNESGVNDSGEENKKDTTEKEGKENITPPKKKTKTASKTSESESPSPHTFNVVAIMTGCESEVDLSREDINNLKKYGIKISNDMSKINTLIAPKILRTEKFLTSLSKVDNIIHPNFIKDLKSSLKQGYAEINIDMDNYRLDKVILVLEINKQLGYTTKSKSINGISKILTSTKGMLLKNYKLNLSPNLNGGYEVLSKILLSHGVEELKLLTGKNVQEKQLIVTESDNDNNPQKIIIVNKTKDQKLIKSFSETCILVEWDWCVKSIFKQEIEDFLDFLVN